MTIVHTDKHCILVVGKRFALFLIRKNKLIDFHNEKKQKRFYRSQLYLIVVLDVSKYKQKNQQNQQLNIYTTMYSVWIQGNSNPIIIVCFHRYIINLSATIAIATRQLTIHIVTKRYNTAIIQQCQSMFESSALKFLKKNKTIVNCINA
jgi:hypothetical protein